MKTFKYNISAILFNAVVAILSAAIFGFHGIVDYAIAAIIANGIMVLLALVKTLYTGTPLFQRGLAYAGILKEIWIGVLMERFYPDSSFLKRSVDMTEFVTNNTIHLADAGVDPDVLTNNTTYPVPIAERADNSLELPLDYFDTVNTVVRNAVQKQVMYNMLEASVRQHRLALLKENTKKAAHAWAPQADGDYTPVIVITTGVIDAFVDAEARYDAVDAPKEGRIAVLSPKHKAKLKKEDKVLFKDVFGPNGSKVLYGFEVYDTSVTPKYAADNTKKAYGAAADAGDQDSSLFYVETEVMRADGEYDMFSRLKDPEARGDIIGFQKRFVALPIRNKLQGAIIGNV